MQLSKECNMNVYFISGLGADSRIFQNIVLPGWCNIIHLDWLMPRRHEPMEEYCRRMAARIDTSRPFALVGLSFGGMVAVELAKIVAPKTVVLISSAANRGQLPPLYRWAGRLGLHHLVLITLVRRMGRLANWFFGVKQPAETEVLQQYLHHTPAQLLKWSIASIVKWKNADLPHNILHLHGTADRVLPIKYSGTCIPIEQGSHFMVWNMATVLNQHLARHLEQFRP